MVLLEEAAANSLLDPSVIDFVTTSMGKVLNVFTTGPIGIFLTIGIVGAVVGLTVRIIRSAKRG